MRTQQLKFAPIIRVSTEQQEKRGESLRTQRSQIEHYVKTLNGIIPDYCWRYAGQESATPDKERTLLNTLLEDSGKGLFDAVIVCDASRWSRDNLKNKEGLNILRANKIRFFVGATEYDLYNPAQNLFLGMSAEIGEYQAREQALKSITNRINRAKRGIPTAGKLPYGRTWNEAEGWQIDEEKQKIIQQAANRYLSGEGIPAIAASLKMNASNLWKLLTKRCGTTWECRFVNKKVNIDEKVAMSIPPLLDEANITAIHERARNNIKGVRGHRKYHYVLTGFVFCKRCGYTFACNTNPLKKQYYRHSKNNKACSFHKFIPANELDNLVLMQLVKTFGDAELIEQAIKKATPDIERRKELTREQIKLQVVLKKISSQKINLIEAVADGLLNKTEIGEKMNKLRSQEEAITQRLSIIDLELSNIPSLEQIKRSSQWAVKVISNSTKNNPGLIFKKDFQWKRRLAEKAFSGVGIDGKRLGVYVDYTKSGTFSVEIKGIFENTVISLPLTDEKLIDAFTLDGEFQNVEKELEKIKSNMRGECDAYFSKRIYQ
ncbi:MAG: recombinase family protein [Bacteroidales bacterium]|nr:recombinase family protein [Bacteroidales bacterium]